MMTKEECPMDEFQRRITPCPYECKAISGNEKCPFEDKTKYPKLQVRFTAEIMDGTMVCGLLSESHGKPGHPEKGLYISNSAGCPWAFQVKPDTIKLHLDGKKYRVWK